MKQQKLLGSMVIIIGLLAFNVSSAFAGIVIKTGSTMKVSNGTELVVSSDVTLESGGTLNIESSGSLILKGNFSNNGTADLGSGEIIFNGTVAQTIGGSTISEFEDLTINNAAGVTLGVGAVVDGTLTLTTGLLTIGANNLTFGAAAPAVAGTPSATAMIVADGAGEVRKAFTDGTSTDPGSFTFPIGDVSGDYSPIVIDFNTSDFSSAYVGVNVTDAIEPNNTSTTDFLTRYWTITQSGITEGYTYDFTATFLPADISGTAANISGGLYDGSDWLIFNTIGATTFSGSSVDKVGNVTGLENQIFAGIKVFLEGAYDDAADEMKTTLNQYLSNTTAADAFAHLGYTGNESVGGIPSTEIVDWILVEVRDATSAAAATVAGDTVAGFLMKDGSIVGMDGTSPLKWTTKITNSAFFVVIPRHSLPVMISSSPTPSFGEYAYDFTDANNKAYTTGEDAQVQVGTAPVVYGMYGGDGNTSGIISQADKQEVDDGLDEAGFEQGDYNYSGIVSQADKQLVDDNIDKTSQVPN